MTFSMPAPRVIIRVYFSSYLLWTAEHLVAKVAEREAELEPQLAGEPRFDIAHRGYVLNAILTATNFLEAMINELFQDAVDQHGITGDGYIARLTEQAREQMAALWRGTREGSRISTLEKYQLMLTCAQRPPLATSSQPYQDANLVIQLRNAIAHFQPEDLSADEPAKMERRLKGKFPDNPLMRSAGNPWWPDKCLGHGCAEWALRAVVALADHAAVEMAIEPNYWRTRAMYWEGLGGPP